MSATRKGNAELPRLHPRYNHPTTAPVTNLPSWTIFHLSFTLSLFLSLSQTRSPLTYLRYSSTYRWIVLVIHVRLLSFLSKFHDKSTLSPFLPSTSLIAIPIYGGSASLKRTLLLPSLFSRCRKKAFVYFTLTLFTSQKLQAQFLINVARINYCCTGSKFFTSDFFRNVISNFLCFSLMNSYDSEN